MTKMNINTMLKVMRTERDCIARQQCDRDCGKCDLVLDANLILEVYDEVIDWLERGVDDEE